SNIDGLVLRNIGHFLYERQRDADPVGHAVFENVQAVLLGLGAADKLRLENLTDGKVRNPTVIRFGAASTAPASAGDVGKALHAVEDLERLSPHLSYASVRAQAVLADLLPDLERAGLRACLFQDLLNALKERVRGAHAARNRLPDTQALPRSPRPDD